MLSLRDVRLRRGPRVLFENANLTIFRGDKVGIVGRNGSGKSSLLSLVRGELAPDLGDYSAPTQLRIASVAQELPDGEQRVVEYVREGDVELIALEAELERAQAAHDGLREATLHAEYDSAGGYSALSRAAGLATGLGFAASEIDRPLSEFSGGLRMRASLARALMRRSDVLILDEPTNHLDLDAVLWLETWLVAYRGTLLVVSHDREFLDGVVGRIVHIASGKVTGYTGHYSDFERQFAAARERDSAMMARQKRERAHVESFVERFRAKASKARQAQSRLKWLARLPQIAEAHEDETFTWAFAEPAKLPRPLVALERVGAGYGERRVIDSVSLSLSPGDRIGILGRNGAGKSTLMRTLAGLLPHLDGDVTAAPDLEVGFFAQAELEQLDPTASALVELTRRGGAITARWSEQQKRNHLGQFGFRGDRVFEPIHTFSGGERARLTLSVLVARRPNMLLLDEPTNHLDFETRHSLLLALQDFEGAVAIVSHDRSLLRGTCDQFIVVGDGAVQPFDGDLEDYAAWLAGKRRAPATVATDVSRATDSPAQPQSPGRSRKDERREAAEARQRLSQLRTEVRRAEQALETLTTRRKEIETLLGNPELYAARPEAERRALATEHRKVLTSIETAEAAWLEASGELESTQQKTG